MIKLKQLYCSYVHVAKYVISIECLFSSCDYHTCILTTLLHVHIHDVYIAEHDYVHCTKVNLLPEMVGKPSLKDSQSIADSGIGGSVADTVSYSGSYWSQVRSTYKCLTEFLYVVKNIHW